MATVYLARDLKHARDVALKLLRDDLPHRSAPAASCARSRSQPNFSIPVRSVRELEQALLDYIAQRNTDPTPFTRIASVRAIPAKVKKANDTLASQH